MIAENLKNIIETIPPHVTLVAVSKTKPNTAIEEAYACGQRIFGENKVQEMIDKYESLPKDIDWHMIGHVQRNKVKYMAPFVSLIHGGDSFRLLKEIDKQAKKCNRTIPVLLQFHIAREDSKFGFSFEEAEEMLQDESFKALNNIEVRGVMGMATFTENSEQIRDEFRTLHNYFQVLKSHFFKYADSFSVVSMGMSGDYPIAIEEGATMIRVGSHIFGERTV